MGALTLPALRTGLAVPPARAVARDAEAERCGPSRRRRSEPVAVDVTPAERKRSAGELADRVGITPATPAVLENGRAEAVRSTTPAAPCEALRCRPGDLPHREPEDTADGRTATPAGAAAWHDASPGQ